MPTASEQRGELVADPAAEARRAERDVDERDEQHPRDGAPPVAGVVQHHPAAAAEQHRVGEQEQRRRGRSAVVGTRSS